MVGDIRDDGSDAATHWPEILRLLRAARYRGFVTLDYAVAASGVEPADAAMPRAARYMRGLLHLLARQEMLRSPNGATADPVPADYRVVRPAAADSDAELREVVARR